MLMKITLINVQIIDGNNLVPPIGILSIAALLENSGHEIQIIDKDPKFFNFINEIKKFNPHMIGIGFLTAAYKRALELTKKLRLEIPKAIYFYGGVHTTIDPINILNKFSADFVVIGEGEFTVLEACERINKEKTLNGIKGTIYKGKNGKIINNGPRPLIENLDKLPLMARHLLNFEKEYLTFPGVIRGYSCKSTTIMTSRGCPYQCIYCSSNNIFGRKVRRRSVENVMEEIIFLIKTYFIRGIYFVDDTFTLDKEYVLKFCRELKKRNISLIYGCQARVNTVDREMLEEMKSAGFVQIDFGVESGSEKILNVLKKQINPKMAERAFKLAKDAGLRTLASFMIGNPYETMEDIKKSFELAKKLNADYTTFLFTTPFPGTELWNLVIKNGWFKPPEEFSEKWTFRQVDLPIMNINFTKKELAHIRARLQNYFFMKNYFQRYNLTMALHIFYLCLKYPNTAKKAISNFIKTGKLDGFLETMLIQHRFNVSIQK